MDYKEIISLVSKVLNPSEYIEVMSFLNSQQAHISNLSDKIVAQQETIMKLNTKIADYESWEKEKNKYEVVQQGRTVVYRLKETTQVFCPKCFNDDHVPIHLQPSHTVFICPKCGIKYQYLEQK